MIYKYYVYKFYQDINYAMTTLMKENLPNLRSEKNVSHINKKWNVIKNIFYEQQKICANICQPYLNKKKLSVLKFVNVICE